MGSLCTSSFLQTAEHWPWHLSGFATGLRHHHLHQKKKYPRICFCLSRDRYFCCFCLSRDRYFCCVPVVVRAALEGGQLPGQTTLTLHGSEAGSIPKQPRGHGGSFSCCSEVEENSHPQDCLGTTPDLRCGETSPWHPPRCRSC